MTVRLLRAARLAAPALFMAVALAACAGGTPTAPTTVPATTLGGIFATAFAVQTVSGDPIQDAQVDVLDGPSAGASCTTGLDGQCTLSVPRWPAPTVRARKEGFVPHIWEAAAPHFTTQLLPVEPE
jgi:hypothetical protein